jgi:MFS family permease
MKGSDIMEGGGEVSKQKQAHGQPGGFWLLYAVCLVEGADLQLLPSTFRALEAEVGLSPSRLAVLGMCQALTQSVSAPFWGSLVDSGWSEKWLLVAGSAAWGVLTLLLAGITEWYSMLALRTLNGIALATLMPVSQTIIAKGTIPNERGYYFGLCELFLCIGQLLCAVLATTVSNEVIWGFDGWRVAFVIVAFASLILALLLGCLMYDSGEKERKSVSFSAEIDMFRQCCKIPSFRIIVVQGCFGSIPWMALSFAIMFFQYVGVTDFQAAVLFASFLISLGLGNVLGGHVGDILTAWSRFHGRPLTAQISVLSGIPLIIWLLVFIPRRASSYGQYGFFMCLFGLTASWCKTGVNRPVLTEVVPESCQARILAWLIALEGSVAACLGASLAGIIAERAFGYEPQEGQLDDMPPDSRDRNANALAMGMLWMCVLPWIVCFLVYGFLHFTYRQDVENVSRNNEMSPLTS